MSKTLSIQLETEYQLLLKDVKAHIHSSQHRVAITVNKELLVFYWEIGNMLLERQKNAKWGDALLDVLAKDLKNSFPDSKGFSRANLNNMRLFAQTHPTIEFVQTLSGQLSWFHHTAVIQYTKSSTERNWYIKQAVENRWSFKHGS